MAMQRALTVIAAIKPEEVEALRNLLTAIGDEVENNTVFPFAELTTIHFARWVMLDQTRDVHDETIPPSLVLATNYDPPLDNHLDQLVRVAGPGLDRIYSHCEGYPAPGDRTEASVLAYLRDHMVDAHAFYIGAHGRSVQQIRREAELRDAIEQFLDQQNAGGGWAGQDPSDAREAIQKFVASEPSLSWARKLAAPPTPAWYLKHYGRLAGLMLGVASIMLGLPAVLAWLLGALLGLSIWEGVGLFVLFVVAPPLSWAVLLRIHEKRDAETAPADDPKHISKLVEREDHIVQNQMTWVLDIKPGWFRLFTLRMVLLLADTACRYVLTRGVLLGVPTVHFARWIIIDRGRRLMFFSNYDGSWENYVGDFVDRAAVGLTMIWSNTVGFPKTRWLTQGGARSEQGFKGGHRDGEPPTVVWYCAYPQLSLQNIPNNSKIRAGLWGDPDRQATREWLRRL